MAQITTDNTGIKSQVIQNGNIINIQGGTQAGNNLFHSFEQFSVPGGMTVEFPNIGSIQNIISRVTGKSISNIDGIVKIDGTANLFLINPNGIVFGPNASLEIGGSFLATTASGIIFEQGIKYSATDPQAQPLLSINTPIGLQFGETAAPIINQSQASPNGAVNSLNRGVGLQVSKGKTLALVGGDITLNGGNLTARSGQIELGSVAPNSLVRLNPTTQGWIFGYEGIQNFQNIRLIQRNDSVIQPSQVDVSSVINAVNKDGGGSINIQGGIVELNGNFVRVRSLTADAGNGKNITINANQLIVKDGARVDSSTRGSGPAGNLIINASESVQLTGNVILPNITGLLTSTAGKGKAGDLTITTKRLYVQDGAGVRADSALLNQQPAEGDGGNININASQLVEISGKTNRDFSSLSALITINEKVGSFRNPGTININTDRLIIRDGGQINVSAEFADSLAALPNATNLVKAGDLNIIARSIELSNEGKITADSASGNGGNISLQLQNLLVIRGQSQISTSAGRADAGGDGGNITIYAPNGFLIAALLGNNDITANAFSGAGGKITINAKRIFGFVPRTRADIERLLGTNDPSKLDPQKLLTSDITAFSQQNPSLNGTIEINSPDVDPSKGLTTLAGTPVDASGLIAASCNTVSKLAGGSLIATGRGGIIPNPTDKLAADAVLADWISLENENQVVGIYNHSKNKIPYSQKDDSVNLSHPIVEAQGWVIDADGNVVLLAQAPTMTLHGNALNPASCAAN
jgi:filamentous hemagglutinin family protein